MTYDEGTMKIYHRRLSNLFSDYDAWCSGSVVALHLHVGMPMTLEWNTQGAFRTIIPSNTYVLIRTRPVAKTLFARHSNDLSFLCLSTASNCCLHSLSHWKCRASCKKNVSCILNAFACVLGFVTPRQISSENVWSGPSYIYGNGWTYAFKNAAEMNIFHLGLNV